ncbi:MAG: hypothetical protein H6713_01300 [Myxococcales bacterium]|nr:hypothetical protein [Myxococcales bacterium]MCB9748619.1 hypothetical protein [Myxococcales bacterium]
MKNRPIVLATLLVGAIASIAESYDMYQTVVKSESQLLEDVLEDDDALRFVVQTTVAGESDELDADLHAALVIRSAAVENPADEPLELIATIAPLLDPERAVTVRLPLHNVAPAPEETPEDEAAEDAEDFDEWRGPYVHSDADALKVLNLTEFPHRCEDAFNCVYSSVIALEPSRPLAEGERIEVSWAAVSAGDFWRWTGDSSDAEMFVDQVLFGASE